MPRALMGASVQAATMSTRKSVFGPVTTGAGLASVIDDGGAP